MRDFIILGKRIESLTQEKMKVTLTKSLVSR